MTMTFEYDNGHDRRGANGYVRKVICSWTSDSSGDAVGETEKVVGELIKAVTDPTDGPTDDYDIVLTDEDGADILADSIADLADRDTTDSETVYFLHDDGGTGLALFPLVCGKITVTVSNAGSVKSGVLVLYFRVR